VSARCVECGATGPTTICPTGSFAEPVCHHCAGDDCDHGPLLPPEKEPTA
jgi:hypothetical protein